MTIALADPVPDDCPDEPAVHWLALSSDEVMDLALAIEGDADLENIATRLALMLRLDPRLTIVGDDG